MCSYLAICTVNLFLAVCMHHSYEAPFIPQLLSDLASFSSPYMLKGRNFNCVLNPCVGMSSPRSASSTKIYKMQTFLSDFVLFNIWRVLHPLDTDYTFFSNPHQVFQNRLLSLFTDPLRQNRGLYNWHPVNICHLSPVAVTISPPYRDPSCRHRRLNPALLHNQRFVDFVTMECERFFVENKTPDISPSILWEFAKAYIHGAIISYTSDQ